MENFIIVIPRGIVDVVITFVFYVVFSNVSSCRCDYPLWEGKGNFSGNHIVDRISGETVICRVYSLCCDCCFYQSPVAESVVLLLRCRTTGRFFRINFFPETVVIVSDLCIPTIPRLTSLFIQNRLMGKQYLFIRPIVNKYIVGCLSM